MGKHQTITLNGVQYDVATGLPVHNSAQKSVTVADVSLAVKPKAAAPRPVHTKAAPAAIAHRSQQKSTTLKRAYVKTPPKKAPVARPAQRSTGHIARSEQIVRFAAHPQVVRHIDDITPVSHHDFDMKPSARMTALQVKLAHKQSLAPSQQIHPTDIKKRLVKASIANHDTILKPPVSATKPSKIPRVSKLLKAKRRFSTKSLIAACLAIALFGGYMTYINMPGLSVKVASAQAGIDGAYPQYQPDGYSFDGPVSFQPGEINLHFRSNGGSGGYTITQKESSWNSVAVLDNYVTQDSQNKYDTTSEGGLMIYTYNHKAVWSNGGVLYTIDSATAPISNDQLIKIATSL